jgi:hypothetical protein
VARYCFCGCGRQVRFSEKRFSKQGAETERILEVLENISVPIVREDSGASARVDALIGEGRDYWAYWRGMIHDGVAPTVGDGVRTGDSFGDWKREAGQLADSHLRAVRARSGRTRAAASPG